MWALDRVRDAADPLKEAVAIFEEDVALCEALAAHGAPLVDKGEALLTHCNAGALATAGIGTAVGVIRRAFEQGRASHVYVDETRPLLQGARLTAWELGKLGIPHTLITDSMAALLLRDGRVQRVFVGADRIAANGDFANKVGTYGLAVNARYHGVPFHPVAPYSTVDPTCATGAAIPIEERRPEEVRGYGATCWNAGSPAFNPSFDVTPVSLVTSLVLDKGVIGSEALAKGGWADQRA
jgi:methylthioribose-1-phosphate isomerase